MKKFAVFGNPIAQSVSPSIHKMFAEQVGESIEYDKLLAPLDGFKYEATAFFSQSDVMGCNVTVPFKGDACALADSLNKAAELAQAVNTLHKTSDGKLAGYNTDGIGLVADLQNQGISLADQKILIIGAGGACRGVVHPLLDTGIATLAITNRTTEKATAIATGADDSRVIALDKAGLSSYQPDIIINSTSASLSHTLPDMEGIDFSHCQLAYDMVYGSQPTTFMLAMRERGIHKVADGLGMLVEQAAASFTIWTAKTVQTAPVIQMLREQLVQKQS
ncbi:shikimate dehydrogenase [Salinimonas lutimaris]|uniref:shikimate dehydrogenase n=1 Tax=Salinimonas lutimaris TaxID=914153 RepID=UPI0010BFDB52|nr:shikimate dehydrogenase [Salinimonas lutimaris]